MSSRRSSSRRRRAPVFPTLSEGVQNGLNRLVSDNQKGVASMLDAEKGTAVDELTEKCAQVMKQQQLSAAQFLARFFEADMLSDHAEKVLNKSAKGSSAQLAERIASEWAKHKVLSMVKTYSEKEASEEKSEGDSEEKKRSPDVGDYDSPIKKKKQKKESSKLSKGAK
jgi:hypothetical protein